MSDAIYISWPGSIAAVSLAPGPGSSFEVAEKREPC